MARSSALVASLVLALAGCATSSGLGPDGVAPDPWQASVDRAMELAGRGDVEGAVEAAREALDLAESPATPDPALVVKSQLVLSSFLIQTGRLSEARTLSEAAHETSEGLLAEPASRVANTLKYLGNLARLEGDLDAAERDFARAVDLATFALGADHPETAKHVGNLAAVALQRGDEARAEELLERALAIWDAQPAPDPVYTVTSLANLAQLRIRQGEPEAAFELYERGLAVQEQAFGSSNPRLANLLRPYARALGDAGRAERAREVEERIAGLAYPGDGDAPR